MKFFIDNWFLIICSICIISASVVAIIHFINLPKWKKIDNLKRWLEKAVTEAEREFGSKTGQLKLRTVYSAAIEKFPWVASCVSFETFDEWVKEALDWMKLQLDTNPEFAKYVRGE